MKVINIVNKLTEYPIGWFSYDNLANDNGREFDRQVNKIFEMIYKKENKHEKN